MTLREQIEQRIEAAVEQTRQAIRDGLPGATNLSLGAEAAYRDVLALLPAEPERWVKSRDQQERCACGHPYRRHFDTYDDMAPVGCKYCGCSEFSPVTSPDHAETD